ncbi:hypothetical protein DXX93_02685 [Thalassotalea euphylliae]|uniref:DUF2306 domain-containing protein n=1 Tax=Thalassotalea euphylliae TaxID=1655234 RepID=A0A3E0TMS1_9GAMM|nr:hypothetical protein [Thalassotalea euphylliae]REL25560.1 hypothetical protein DXX93_02685 [Thalassotalea euphylliae]
MYYSIYSVLLFIHVAIGTVSLITFWLPVISQKGGKLHKKSGKWFEYGMLAVAVTGIAITVMTLADPIAIKDPQAKLSGEEVTKLIWWTEMFAWFLLMLSLLVWNSTRHSILVLKCRDNRQILRQWPHLLPIIAMALISPYVGYLGTKYNFVLLQVFSVLCLANVYQLLRYTFKPNLQPREWLIQHLRHIIGAGIGAYTAFFAFGGRQLLASVVSGQWQIVFWVLPGVIGGILTHKLVKKYRKQYRVA